MPGPLATSNSRFLFESHDHNGTFVATLPYRNAQGEFFLGSRGSQFRCSIPYRRHPQVTTANLYPGKHELWVYDQSYSKSDPIFAGPIWDITANSADGTLDLSAQDPLTYFAKRLLKVFKAYSSKTGVFMINDLVSYTAGIRALNLIVNIQATNTQTSSPYYFGNDRNVIGDLINTISAMDDGTDYYMRCLSGVHNLMLFGGQIKPTAKPYVLEYGGTLDGYSVQYNAQAIGNDIDEISSIGVIQNAADGSKKTEYNALYEIAEQTDQSISADVLQTATTRLKDTKSTKVIPSLVTRKLTPIKDFDFGDQFITKIDDWYVQVNQTIRTIGWQYTIGQGDEATTVIYSKDTEGVT